MRGLLNEAVALAEGGVEPWAAFRRTGWEGWTGDETLAIAVYAAVRHPASLEDAGSDVRLSYRRQ